MPYKAFPILDIRSGVQTDVEPWKLPGDAWESLENGSLRKGILAKRLGKILFGQIVHTDSITQVPTLQTNPVMGINNFLNNVALQQLIVFDKARMNSTIVTPITDKDITAFANAGGGNVEATSASHGFSDDDIITQTGTYPGTFRVQNKTPNTYEFTDTFTTNGTGTASQERFKDVTNNKIRYIGKTGQNYTPAVDDVLKGDTSGATATVKRVILDAGTVPGEDARGTIIFGRGTVTGTFQDNEELQQNGTPANIAGQSQGANSDDTFTGDNTNFFWVVNWMLGGSNRMYIANNKDPIQKYNGTDLSRLVVNIGGDNDINDLNSCLLIFIVKERIVLFSTNENGEDFFQRARWSAIKDPDTWPTESFKDAPTQDQIKSAGFIGDDLYVWFRRSVWRFAYTGDSTNPFEWERVDETQGCEAQMSLVEHENIHYVVGKTRLQLMDGRRVLPGDLKIPDVTAGWTQNSVLFSNALKVEEQRHIATSYASAGASENADGNIYPDKILLRNYEDQSFSNWTHDVHVIGESEVGMGAHPFSSCA